MPLSYYRAKLDLGFWIEKLRFLFDSEAKSYSMSQNYYHAKSDNSSTKYRVPQNALVAIFQKHWTTPEIVPVYQGPQLCYSSIFFHEIQIVCVKYNVRLFFFFDVYRNFNILMRNLQCSPKIGGHLGWFNFLRHFEILDGSHPEFVDQCGPCYYTSFMVSSKNAVKCSF